MVVVDMVGYSDVAKMLEENTSAGSVASLNQQVQAFIRQALSNMDDQHAYGLVARTGDGAIVLFEGAEDAHLFAAAVHCYAKAHNDQRTEQTAKRWFRIGIATGEVHKQTHSEMPTEYAGITIANAVRLESSGASGQVVIDVATYEALPNALRACYGPEEAVKGKRNEAFRARRYQTVCPSKMVITGPTHAWTRRRTLGVTIGALAAATLGGWLEWPAGYRWIHPLPTKRFVALIAWPLPSLEQTPRVAGLLEAVHARLSRTETYVHDLLILGSEDMKQSVPENQQDINGSQSPRAIANSWGANLLLAASLTTEGIRTVLHLHLLEAQVMRLLRKEAHYFTAETLGNINRISADLSASLLDLPILERNLSDEQELASVAIPVREAFLRGKLLSDDPGDAKNLEAVDKLHEGLEAAPSFALGHATLGLLYLRKYNKSHDTAALELAKSNLSLASRLNPSSETAQIGQAQISLAIGMPEEALTLLTLILKEDPGNTDALFLKSRVFKQLGKTKEQEQIYRQIINLRPNYWKAYNDLGKFLFGRARYEEAAQYFKISSLAAPHEVLPLNSLGQIFIAQGKREEARNMFDRSLAITPNEAAYENLGNLSYEEKNYPKARDYYAAALKTLPTSHFLWSDLADAHEMLGEKAAVSECYGRASRLLASQLSINPNDGSEWMILSLYKAKSGDKRGSMVALDEAEHRKANDTHSTFIKSRVLMTLGRDREAKTLVLKCIEEGLEPAEVELAPELGTVRSTLDYLSLIQKRRYKSP